MAALTDAGAAHAKKHGDAALQEHKRIDVVGASWGEQLQRHQMHSDFAVLTRKGESQAKTSRQMLLVDSFDSCFYRRCCWCFGLMPCEIVCGSLKVHLQERNVLRKLSRTLVRNQWCPSLFDLREIDLYSFQGLYKQEGKDMNGENYKMWQKDAANFEIDGHYPVRELCECAQSWWESILNSDGISILVVAHNAVNQALVATATGLGSDYFRQLLQSNCGVSALDFTPRTSAPYACLDRLNQALSLDYRIADTKFAFGTAGPEGTLTRVFLVCHEASTESSLQGRFPARENENVNVLGCIQVQEAADCLGGQQGAIRAAGHELG